MIVAESIDSFPLHSYIYTTTSLREAALVRIALRMGIGCILSRTIRSTKKVFGCLVSEIHTHTGT